MFRLRRTRPNYWSCSKFASIIRGTKKPVSATLGGWNKWREENIEHNPVRYYIAEELLDKIQDIVMFPYDVYRSIKCYIDNRFITKSHAITASKEDVPRGQWCDLSHRMIYCLFNELVDFVEVELANIQRFDKEKSYTFEGIKGRCKQAGLDNLEWQKSLKYDEHWVSKDDPLFGKPTDQALAAEEIYKLYMWWTETRKNRPDPTDASGYSEWYDKQENPFFTDRTEEERKELKPLLDKCNEIEAEYEKEDEEMLIRLIKIRNSLWT